MLRHLRLAVIALAGLGMLGCDRREQAKSSVTTTTRPAEGVKVEPTTAPATRPAFSVMQVGEEFKEFPKARLVLRQTEPTIGLILFSDDPKEAILPGYRGNRYYLEIDLNISDLAHLASADWMYRAASMERVETLNGIFLDGDHKHLQPYEVNIAFSARGSEVVMMLAGQFTQYHQRDAAPPTAVMVRGVVVAELERPRGR